MKRNCTAALLVLASVLSAAEDDGLREYQFVKELQLRGTPGTSAAIPFDPDLYRAANDDYSNIRILDRDGKTVPFAVRNVWIRTDKTDHIRHPGKITDFSYDPQTNTASAVFTLDKPNTVSRLVFPANTGKFNKTVSLEFFDEKGIKTGERRGLPLRKYGKIFGSSAVDFKPEKTKKIRIVISRYVERKKSEYVTEATGKFDRVVQQNIRNEEYALKEIIACEAVTRKAPEKVRTVPVDLPEIKREEKGKITEITADARRVPCCELRISAEDKNYNRGVEIISVSDRQKKTLKHTLITPNTQEITLPESRGEQYIVMIRNGDNAPLKNVRLQWKVKDKILVVVPPKEGGLKLYYGGKAEKQTYDIEKYADSFGDPPRIYESGKEQKNPAYDPALKLDDVFRYLMWAALAVTAVMLLLTIVRMLNKTPDAGEKQE